MLPFFSEIFDPASHVLLSRPLFVRLHISQIGGSSNPTLSNFLAGMRALSHEGMRAGALYKR